MYSLSSDLRYLIYTVYDDDDDDDDDDVWIYCDTSRLYVDVN